MKAGFGIEALMAGSDLDGEALGEVLGDPKALSEGDLQCSTVIVCAPLYIGKCLWINPSGFHMQAYCGCDTTC